MLAVKNCLLGTERLIYKLVVQSFQRISSELNVKSIDLPQVCPQLLREAMSAWSTGRTTATIGLSQLRYGPIRPTLRPVAKLWV